MTNISSVLHRGSGIRKKLGVPIAAVMAAALLGSFAWVSPASGALSDGAGWPCTASSSKAGWTLLATPQPGWPVSPLVQEPRAVIVNWGTRVGPGLAPIVQQLGVFQAVGGAGDYRKVAETATETMLEGMNEFPVRIPVQGGDLVGLHGPVATLVCEKEEVATSALFEGAVALGETKAFKSESGLRPPVWATVEVDVDGDGYGDASQDRCPESALFQSSCPLVDLSIGDITVKRRAILIEVGVNSTASVEALGEVCWTARPKADNRAKHSTMRRSCQEARVGLGTLGAQTIEPGVPVTLRVPLPKAVGKRLEQLSPQGSLRARIDVKATNLVPYTGTHALKVKLPGRAKPQRPR